MVLSADMVPFIYKHDALCSSLQGLWHIDATREKISAYLFEMEYIFLVRNSKHRKQVQVYQVLFVH